MNHMKAKEYLEGIQKERRNLKKLEEKYKEKRSRLYLGSSDTGNSRVQSSKWKPEDGIVSVEEMEHEIDCAVYDYMKNLDTAVNSIQCLTDIRFMKILYDHYIPDAGGNVKSLKQIAKETGYTYKYTCTLLNEGLQALDSILWTNASIK